MDIHWAGDTSMEGKKVDLFGSSSPASDCESEECAGETGLLKTW